MDHLSSHELVTKIINYVIFFWMIFFVPLFIMSILIFTGHGNVAAHDELSWKILYYNLLLFPFIILFSTIGSWLLLKKKKYWSSLILVLLPLVNIFVEMVVLDLILWFTN